jgi:hypothetical protein
MNATETALIEDLHEAINRAEGAGKCSYLKGCVVGQLMWMNGVKRTRLSKPLDAFSSLDDGNICNIWQEFPEMHKYPQDLLRQLQNQWDLAEPEGADKARAKMHTFVNEWFDEEPPNAPLT